REPSARGRIHDPSMRGIVSRQLDMQLFLERALAIQREELPAERRLDLDLLRRQFRLSVDAVPFRRHLMPVTHRSGPQISFPQFADRVPIRTPQDLEDYVARCSRISESIDSIRDVLEAGLGEGVLPPKGVMQGVLEQCDAVQRGGLRELERPLDRPPQGIDAAQLADMRERVNRAREGALLSLGLLRLWLADAYIPACRDTIAASDAPEGVAAYAFDVRRFTTTELTPKEVHEIGLREVARILTEMDQVIARTDWLAADPARAQLPADERRAAFIAYLRTDPRFYCTSGEELLSRYRDICKRIDALLPEHFGKLPRLPYGVREIPRFMAPQQTTAYYMPGSMKAGLPGWFYANTYALDQRPTYEIVPLSLHEAVPGHHLQIAISQELEGLPEFRQDVESTAFIEGWALYAERLGIPMGLYEDPYDDFGRLLYEMWRSCRLVVDTGMHALGMSRADAIAYMTRHTALSPLNIEREIDRYISWPGQALAYKIGELRIRAIRDECERLLGPAFDVRAFHDHLLWAGPLPLDVLELRMREWAQSRAAR
ncbi:MAG: DUF885 domain-containing protein, partial [Phycisphaerales bacterium]|nr:DUF885 domain-containing protein [Phycisphaerales bacterium]